MTTLRPLLLLTFDVQVSSQVAEINTMLQAKHLSPF